MADKVVTRFAPSPTGYLHVGGARTALFNWLVAKKSGGQFILRIEDTDVKRNTPTAAKQVMEDMRWLGILWDQGPEVGGENGPYLQSERRDIYDKYLKQLLNEGKAYYCFDTSEELEAMREKATREKRANLYPRPEKFPTEEDAENAKAQGRDVTVRFAVPQDEEIVVQDIIRGEVKFPAGEFGDFIIQKSDGFPTYHFAVVVDDELMGVTHVIRGQEHLMNTPLHQWLQKGLGFRVPEYAHMSVTVSEGGGKLSKRERPKTLKLAINSMQQVDYEELAKAGGISVEDVEGYLKGKLVPDMPAIDAIAEHLGVHLPEINVVDFLKSGYLPETMINFLALLGWNPGDDREVMSIDELIEAFDMSRLTKSNSFFDRKKLLSFNTEHISRMDGEKLVGHFRRYLDVIESPVRGADDETLLKIIKMNEGARTLEQIETKSRFAFVSNDGIEYDAKAVKKVLKGDGVEMLKIVRGLLAGLREITEQSIEDALRNLAEEKGVGLGKVAQPLRVAICGNTVSPPIFDSVKMLGMENVLARIDLTLRKYEGQV